MSQHDRYISPFSTRYASDEMQYIFSDDNKFRTWRRLWVALARAEMNQGLTNITPEMVAELEAHVDDINYEVAIEREKLVRHDVMSHVYAYGQQFIAKPYLKTVDNVSFFQRCPQLDVLLIVLFIDTEIHI